MDSAKYCDIGGRQTNEDYALELISGDNGLFIVADGLGGHGNGDKASSCVAETMREVFFDSPQANPESVRNLLETAQNRLLDIAEQAGLSGMRTTAVVLAVCKDQAVWGHIGDSRLYHIRNGKISAVTPDHSVAYLSYLNGEIKYDEIKDSPDQNRLIRSMGSKDKFKPEISAQIFVEPGDAFLLCSDGFWEYVSQKEILETCKKSATSSRWLAKMIRIIEKKVRLVDNNDNCSAVTVFI